jgi:hypothetical protein
MVARDEYYRNFPPVRYAFRCPDAVSLPKPDIRDDEVGCCGVGFPYRVRLGGDDRADLMAHVLDKDLELPAGMKSDNLELPAICRHIGWTPRKAYS